MCRILPHRSFGPALTVLAVVLHGVIVLAADTAEDVALHRQWAERAFAEKAQATAPGNRLLLVSEGHPGDTKIGRGSAGGPLRLGDKLYQRGIGVNSHSVLRVELVEPAARFQADIGMDRNVDNTPASSAFHVAAGGKDLLATKVLRPADGMQKIDVPLNGARQFDLIVDEGGNGRGWDQGIWADARVVLASGKTLYLDDLANWWQIDSQPPFSFVYDGRPSRELIGKWRRSVRDETVDAARWRRTLVLSDPATGLEVSAAAIVYLDTPGVEWTLHFTNRGTKPTPFLEQVKAVDMTVAGGPQRQITLHRLVGSPCRIDDWLPLTDVIAAGSHIEFAPSGGRSSSGASPWFNVQWNGGGAITAVGWSGQWSANVEHAKDGACRVAAGMESMRLKLAPGESIRSPRIMQLYWSGSDPFRAYNQFRQTMLAHIVPRIAGRPVVPPIIHMSTSFYELNDSNESNVLSHLDSARGLGFELFWLDAYWTRDGFPNGMGHYGFPIERVEPRDRFPHGLRPIGDAAHAAGMGYLMWFEPERVAPKTMIAKEHPEWVISPAGDGSGHINLGIPAAREYLTKYLIEVVRQYRLTWLRIDYNIDPLGFWQFLDKKDPDRVGMAEIRYIEGLYRMWDDILAAHPHLAIDNCASGGRRIDLETCSRSIPLWRSDNTCDMLDHQPATVRLAAIKNQVMTAGLSRYVPFSLCGQMGATPYLFRSGFNAGIAFGEDCRPRDYPRDLLKQAIAEGKRLRKYYFGNLYTLSEVTTSAKDWLILQYHRPAEQDGMVVAFRRHESPYFGFAAELREIDPDAEYEVVRSPGYVPSAPQRVRGSELLHAHLDVPERPGSIVLEYQRLAPAK